MKTPKHYVRSTIIFSGIDCIKCAEKLVQKIRKLPQVAEAQLYFGAGFIRVVHNDSIDDILEFIALSGYGAIPAGDNPEGWSLTSVIWKKALLGLIAGLLFAVGIFGARFGVNPSLTVYFLIGSAVTGGYSAFRAALNSVWNMVLDINVLVSASALGVMMLGRWSEVAAGLLIFNAGNLLQSYVVLQTRIMLNDMIGLTPTETRLISRFGVEQIVPVEEVRKEDMVLVKPGEYITVDGVVSFGESRVDQRAITGEVKFVEKRPGDRVVAGSINQDGSLHIRVQDLAKDFTLMKMIEMVEEAHKQKGPFQQFIDIFTGYYTPAVLMVGFLTVVIPVWFFDQALSGWFYKALLVLILACPCALSLSASVSMISAIGNAARKGILIKSGACLETLAAVDRVIFEKTGTVTIGRLGVTGIIPVKDSEEQLLTMAAAVERFSSHPIGRAVMEQVNNRHLTIPEAFSFISYPGKGVRASLSEQYIHVGNEQLMAELGVVIPEAMVMTKTELEEQGNSIIYVTLDYQLKGFIAVMDTPRVSSREMVDQLKIGKIESLAIISGDSVQAVERIASEAGIDQYFANVLPEERSQKIVEFTAEGVSLMVGEGVNDSAMKAAAIGLAVNGASHENVLETAEVTLMGSDIRNIPPIIGLGRQTRTVIYQNFIAAIILKLLFLILTVTGVFSLWMVVLADTCLSMLVTLNGLRLAGYSFYSGESTGEEN